MINFDDVTKEKMNLYAKNLYEAKYRFLIGKRESTGLK